VASKDIGSSSGVVIPGMVEIFSFEPDFGSATFICKTICKLKFGWAVHVRIIGSKFFPEGGIVDGRDKGLFEFDETVKQ